MTMIMMKPDSGQNVSSLPAVIFLHTELVSITCMYRVIVAFLFLKQLYQCQEDMRVKRDDNQISTRKRTLESKRVLFFLLHLASSS